MKLEIGGLVYWQAANSVRIQKDKRRRRWDIYY